MEMKLAASLNRLGTETAFSVLAEAKKLEAKGHPMIHLGLGQPDFKTPKHVVDAAKKALDDGHHGYVMSNGIPECRQAVTRWIKKRYNADVDFERILIMPGGKPTMTYAIQCFGEISLKTGSTKSQSIPLSFFIFSFFGQRVQKLQPFGGFEVDGTSPCKIISFFFLSFSLTGSGIGMAESKAIV